MPDEQLPVASADVAAPSASGKVVWECCQRKRDNWDWLKFGAELVGLGFLIAYTIFTAKIYCANRMAADAARDSAATAKDTLIASNRPWVNAEIQLKSPLTFSSAGMSLPVLYTLKNTGHSPAMSVWSLEELFLAQNMERDTEAERDRLCGEATKAAVNMGQTIFPGADFTGIFDTAVANSEVQKASEASAPGFVNASLIVCIAYQSTVEAKEVWHHTGIVYELWTVDERGVKFATPVGKDIPLTKLRIGYSFFRAVVAN